MPRFTFKVQDTAWGIADALLLAEGFVHGEKMTVILGDNILTYNIKPPVDAYALQPSGARVLLKKIWGGDPPERVGIATLEVQSRHPLRPRRDLSI
jgi:glucose-1-phosphate thymidylyltransferase